VHNDKQATLKFSNHRDWHDYLAAIQCAGPCPKVIKAFRSGRAWISNSRVAEDIAPGSWLAVEQLAR
jgi:hypothetical protein